MAEASNVAVVTDEVVWGLVEIQAVARREAAVYHEDGSATVKVTMDDGKQYNITVSEA